MNRIHRIVTNVWHEACWATASEWADRVRAETRALQLRDSFDLGRRVGMSVAECAEIARGNGWSEDEIAAASA